MKKILITLLIITAACMSFTAYSQDKKSGGFKKYQLVPVDESAADKEFNAFMKEFRKAVAAKDIASLKKMISPDIIFSFGDDGTDVKSFLKFWKLDKNHKQSQFWDQMDRVLATVPSASDEEGIRFYVFPYVFDRFPGADYDSYSFAAVTGKKVNVRKTPSQNGRVAAILDYEIVKIIEVTPDRKTVRVGGKAGSWVKIMTAGGIEGYVFDYYLHSPIGYRAFFKKEGGKWMLTHFISGD